MHPETDEPRDGCMLPYRTRAHHVRRDRRTHEEGVRSVGTANDGFIGLISREWTCWVPARQTRSKALWSALLEQLLLLLVLLAVEWTQSTKDAIEMMCSSPRTKPRQFGHWLLDRGGAQKEALEEGKPKQGTMWAQWRTIAKRSQNLKEVKSWVGWSGVRFRHRLVKSCCVTPSTHVWNTLLSFHRTCTHNLQTCRPLNSSNRCFFSGVMTFPFESVRQGWLTWLVTSFECVMGIAQQFLAIVHRANRQGRRVPGHQELAGLRVPVQTYRERIKQILSEVYDVPACTWQSGPLCLCLLRDAPTGIVTDHEDVVSHRVPIHDTSGGLCLSYWNAQTVIGCFTTVSITYFKIEFIDEYTSRIFMDDTNTVSCTTVVLGCAFDIGPCVLTEVAQRIT